MSWSKFLSQSPVLKTTQPQLRSSMKKRSLRLDDSFESPFICHTEQDIKRVTFPESMSSPLGSIYYIGSNKENSNTQLKSTALEEINETLKQIKHLTIQGNNNVRRFLNIIQEKGTERRNKKVSKSRDTKSTTKKSTRRGNIEDKVQSRIKEFQKMRKEFKSCIRRVSTTGKLPRR